VFLVLRYLHFRAVHFTAYLDLKIWDLEEELLLEEAAHRA